MAIAKREDPGRPSLALAIPLPNRDNNAGMTDNHATLIYHNPRCSKSRQTLALLQQRGIEPQVIEYLQQPPTRARLEELLSLLQLQPRDLIRTTEPEYAGAGLDDPHLTDEQLIDAMVACPKLIQRPIVVADGKAIIGRPPEKVLEIL